MRRLGSRRTLRRLRSRRLTGVDVGVGGECVGVVVFRVSVRETFWGATKSSNATYAARSFPRVCSKNKRSTFGPLRTPVIENCCRRIAPGAVPPIQRHWPYLVASLCSNEGTRHGTYFVREYCCTDTKLLTPVERHIFFCSPLGAFSLVGHFPIFLRLRTGDQRVPAFTPTYIPSTPVWMFLVLKLVSSRYTACSIRSVAPVG